MKRLIKISFLRGLSLIFLCVSFSSANGQGNQKVIDTFDRFLQYWDRTQNLPDQERIKWFKTEVISQAPDLYEALFSYTNDQMTPDERILSNLKKFPEIEQRSREIYQQLSLDIGSNLKSFSTAFPDFDPSACDIVILHSLNGSNGAVLDVKDRCVFYLGVDAIATNNDWSNQTPFFHHEFFHAYHFTKFKPDKFYSFLWMEGLAVYVAKSLNPGATNAELMLDSPKGLISKVKPHFGMILDDIEKNLERNDLSLRIKYFFLTSTDPEVPPRTGYYVGYLIAQKVAKGKTLLELASMNELEVLRVTRKAIKELRQEILPYALD